MSFRLMGIPLSLITTVCNPLRLSAAVMYVVLTSLTAAPARSDDRELEIPIAVINLGARPAGFYSLSFSKDPERCNLLEGALNEPYGAGASPLWVPLALMGNRHLAAAWATREFVVAPEGNADGGEARRERAIQAIIDLDNDGEPNAVYRRFGSISGHEIESLIVSGAPSPEEMSGNPIPYPRYLEIIGTETPNLSDTLSNLVIINVATSTPNNDEFYDPYYFYEIVVIKDRRYILAARSSYWNRPRVSMFEYRSPHQLSLICQFKANYRLVGNTPQ